MKAVLILLFAFAFHLQCYSQADKVKHFEINVSALFWTPTGKQIKAFNTNRIVEHSSIKSSDPHAVGYGGCIAPKLELTYYFKNHLGITLGFNYLSLTNELEFEPDSYNPDMIGFIHHIRNTGHLYNIQLGYSGKTNTLKKVNLIYGAGINLLAHYHLERTTNYESAGPPYDAKGTSLGVYLNTGIIIPIYKFLSLKTAFEYSYIPTTVKNVSIFNDIYEEKTNLGGIAGQIGISFNF